MDTPPTATKKTFLNSFKKTSLTPCRRLGLGRPSPGSLTRSLHEVAVNTSLQNDTAVSKNVKSYRVCNENMDEKPIVPKASFILNKSSGSRVRRCLTTGSKTPSVSTPVVKKIFSDNNSDISLSCNASNCSLVNSKTIEHDNKQESKVKKRKLDLHLSVECDKEADQDKNTNNYGIHSELSTDKNDPYRLTHFEEKENITSDMVQQLALSIIQKKKRLEELKVQSIYAKKHNLEEMRAQTASWRRAGQEAIRYAVSLARNAGYSVTVEQLMSQHGFPPHLMRYNADDDEFY